MEAVEVALQACVDLMVVVFKITTNLKLTACLAGGVMVQLNRPCPQVALQISGYASFSIDLYLDFWVCTISFWKLTLTVMGSESWYEDHCWWVLAPWNDCRRRWWRRRRNHRHCNYNNCDVILTGTVDLQKYTFRARLEFKYWTKNRVIEIFVKLQADPIFGPWVTAWEMCVYRRWV